MKVSESKADLDSLMREVRSEVSRKQQSDALKSLPMPIKLEVDDILARIRSELASIRLVKHADAAVDETRSKGGLGGSGSVRMLSVETPPELELRKAYRLQDLLCYHDSDFVHTAYRAVLGRSPDQAGFEHYRSALASGRLSKVEVLGRLRYTPEGRANGTHVAGLLVRYVGRLAFRIPVIGLLLGACYYAVRLPALAGSIDRLQGHVDARARLVAAQTNLALQSVDDMRRSEQVAVREKVAELVKLQERELSDICKQLVEGTTQVRNELTARVDAAILRADQRLSNETRHLFDEFEHKLAQAVENIASQVDACMSLVRDDFIARLRSELGALESRTSSRAQYSEVMAGAALLEERVSMIQSEIEVRLPEEIRVIGVRVTEALQRFSALEQVLNETIIHDIDASRRRAVEHEKRTEGALAELMARVDPASGLSDGFYAAFEDQFRGTREDIKERVRVYLPYLRDAEVGAANSAILDIGCGRGEWLEVLREQGLHARGIDLNEEMVRRCRESGLAVDSGDAYDCMRRLPDACLGGVASSHLVEHLPIGALVAIVREALRVLQPGGILIIETPNPENLVVGACSFYIDFTHRKPIPPAALKFLIESTGFVRAEIVRLHPPAVQPDESLDALPSRVREAFTGAQDYAVIAYKP